MIKIRNGVFETNSSSSHSLVYKNPMKKTWRRECYYKKGKSTFWYGYQNKNNGQLTINFEYYGWQRKEVIKAFNEKLNYLMTYFAHEFLAKQVDPDYKFKKNDSEYDNEYLWNDYDDAKANERWQKGCGLLDTYEEVKKVKEILKSYDPNFKGFKYKWWSELDDNDVKNASESDLFQELKPETNLMEDISHPYWHYWDHEFKHPRLGKIKLQCGWDKFQKFGGIDHESFKDSNDQMYEIRQMGYERFLFDENIILIIDHDNH